MNEETQGHVFEPFFTTKSIGKGTGLGLATVYGIVRQSGGHIQVETARDRGTTFRIFLPLSSEEIAEAAMVSGPSGDTALPQLRGRVLVVDDAKVIRTVLRRVLESAGCDVIDAADVTTAIELLRNGPVDLVLTDLQMPGRSGAELAQLVVRDFPGIRVIAMSGFEDIHLRQLPRELGIDAALMKPMQPEVLVEAIRAALERKKRSEYTAKQ
jgi:CheY-like chemotaxis protein